VELPGEVANGLSATRYCQRPADNVNTLLANCHFQLQKRSRRFIRSVRKAGGRNLERPEICEDYSPGYYAFFLEDPGGNNLEICCRESPIVAK
jgi:hypothetical protein